jgi:hypothetical protein
MLSLALNGITSFSIRPIRFVTFLGFLVSVISIVMMLMVLIDHLRGIGVEGYPTITISIWFLGGVQLLALGIIGEYVGRIYIGQNQAPQYVIKEKTWKTSIEENSNGAADH